MKLTIQKDTLSKKLGLASKFLPSNPALPILNTVLLKATDKLEITTNNLEAGIRLLADCKVIQTGSIAIPARKFVDFVSGLPSEEMVMSLNKKSLTLNIKCGKQEANIKCRNPKDLAIAISIEAAELLELFRFREINDDEIRLQILEESMDILIFLLSLANVVRFDISLAFENKMAQNRKKYPIEENYGSAKKYDKLG